MYSCTVEVPRVDYDPNDKLEVTLKSAVFNQIISHHLGSVVLHFSCLSHYITNDISKVSSRKEKEAMYE